MEAKNRKDRSRSRAALFLHNQKSGRSAPLEERDYLEEIKIFLLEPDKYRGHVGALVVAFHILVRPGKLVAHANVPVGYIFNEVFQGVHSGWCFAKSPQASVSLLFL